MLELTLRPETQRLLADIMAAEGYDTADELVFDAMLAFRIRSGPPTDAELDAALDEADRGEGVPWEQAKSELMARYNISLRK